MDLTKITTPFGLLDAETQEALRAHGGPYEVWSAAGWIPCAAQWRLDYAYRVKPQPPKPREWWLCRDEKTEPFSAWDHCPSDYVWSEVIRVCEVLE